LSNRAAICIGIDNYTSLNKLDCCVLDAVRVGKLLAKHNNGNPNYEVHTFTKKEDTNKDFLLKKIEKLLMSDNESVVIYFSGHGYIDEDLNGYICSIDTHSNDCKGISMKDINTLIQSSKINDINIILDCCYSSAFSNQQDVAHMKKGVSILASSRENEVSIATKQGSIFTQLLINALEGYASDILGKITMAYIYAYIDKSLGALEQRPVFKTHTTKFNTIREAQMLIDTDTLDFLRDIHNIFEDENSLFSLDPTFEPDKEAVKRELCTTNPERSEENERIFGLLQKLVKVNIVEPTNEAHMYYEAINNGSCRLTTQGKIYHRLAKRNMI
jgi:hypothetical protein